LLLTHSSIVPTQSPDPTEIITARSPIANKNLMADRLHSESEPTGPAQYLKERPSLMAGPSTCALESNAAQIVSASAPRLMINARGVEDVGES